VSIHAVRIHETGGPDVLRWEEVEVGKPGAGQVRLRHTACGLNLIDTYMRSGLYPLPEMPAILGVEGAGVVQQVGEGVDHLAEGDRVVYALVPGSYTEERLIGVDRLVKLPDTIDDQTGAAYLLKGLTAYFLLFKTHEVKRGDTILVYAAAGATGSILCQWAHHIGARVIGTASSTKADKARANGCDEVICYDRENVAARAKALTGGKGVDVVYDSLGADTFEASLDALRPLGLMVSFGNATGPVPPFKPLILAEKGSLYITRPTLATHLSIPDFLPEASEQLFEAIAKGVIRTEVNQSYPLKDTAQAHRDLESKNTVGATVLLP